MLLAHKIELQPNEAQHLNKACDTVRHCYNQLLEHFSKKENSFSLLRKSLVCLAIGYALKS